MDKQQALFEFCLRQGDNYLILGQRLSEICGHGPILEQDIALTNIALDLLGQSRFYLTYAAQIEGKGRTEDDLAFFRDILDFRNALLTEQPNGDFAQTIARQFFFDAFNYYMLEELTKSSDPEIKGFAEKGLKEVTYHLRFSTDWMFRLGDGTEESHERLQNAVDDLWMVTGDLFEVTDGDAILVKEGVIPEMSLIRDKWNKKVAEVLNESTLTQPASNFQLNGSRGGNHTEHLGFILAELQFMQRTYPGEKW